MSEVKQVTNKPVRKDGGVAPPINIGGLFATSDDSEDENDLDGEFNNKGESQTINVGSKELLVRQFAWHQANANQVWPGTFILANFMEDRTERYNTQLLELGAATGALTIYLRLIGFKEIITSDINDGGEVEENVIFNTAQNGLDAVVHVPHTWGTGWGQSVCALSDAAQLQLRSRPFRIVFASDILLYVSAYPALVDTLKELFASGEVVEFLMAWNRRISASGTFFDMMRNAGFFCHHHGHCIYSFYTRQSVEMDSYLRSLDVDNFTI